MKKVYLNPTEVWLLECELEKVFGKLLLTCQLTITNIIFGLSCCYYSYIVVLKRIEKGIPSFARVLIKQTKKNRIFSKSWTLIKLGVCRIQVIFSLRGRFHFLSLTPATQAK